MLNQLLFCFSLIFPGVRLGADSQFSDFLDGLGPAQLVGRQTLATPAMGKNNMFSSVKRIISQLTNTHTARLQHQKDFYKVASFTVNMKVLYAVGGIPKHASIQNGGRNGICSVWEVSANLISSLKIGVTLQFPLKIIVASPIVAHCEISTVQSLYLLATDYIGCDRQFLCTCPSLVHLTPEHETSAHICNTR